MVVGSLLSKDERPILNIDKVMAVTIIYNIYSHPPPLPPFIFFIFQLNQQFSGKIVVLIMTVGSPDPDSNPRKGVLQLRYPHLHPRVSTGT